MANSPAVSVVMPAYNVQRYVRAAVESILGQTFVDFEFIIVNDGSTDDTRRILEEYAGRDTRVHLIHQDNAGVTRALNAGLQLARGEFIARMDADDISLPGRFAAQVEYLRAHAECVAVGCRYVEIDADGAERAEPPSPATHEQIVALLMEGKAGAMPHPGVMIRHDALRKAGGYRPQFQSAQDLDLWLRLEQHGKFANVQERLLKYRLHAGGITGSRAAQQGRDARAILREAYRRRGRRVPRGTLDWHRDCAVRMQTDWMWKALDEGRFADARAHARFVLRAAPLRADSWKLWAHAMLGPRRTACRGLYRRLRGRTA